jgi:diguanylate cyclase (GGDEF)-like protein
MMPEPILNDEEGRLAALAGYHIMDTEPEVRYDKMTSLLKLLLDVPMVFISLVDADRQWLKSRQGIRLSEMPRSGSLCDHAIKASKPLMISDVQRNLMFRSNPLVAEGIRSYAGVPLQTPDGYHIGTLAVMDTSPRTLSPGQVEILENFSRLVMDEMELRRVAQSDSLTGAMSERAFTAECDKAIAWFRRNARPSVLAVMVLDGFGTMVGEDGGQSVGDLVLKTVAGVCLSSVREKDRFGRLEGEKFAFMLNDTTLPEAMAAAERFRRRISSIEVPIDGMNAHLIKVTASFGVAPLQASTLGFEQWIQAADAGLQRAREAGGNVCFPGILDD